MKYYGLDSDGLLKIPSVSSLPTYNYTLHEGKVYYNETDDTFYIGYGNPTGNWYDIFSDSVSASRTISFYQPTEDPTQSAVKYAYYDEDELFLADWVLKIPHVSSLPTYDHTIHKGLSYYLTTNNTVYVGVGTTGGGWRGITSSGIIWQTITTNTTASPFNGYLINASLGNVTVTLPSSPSEGDVVSVCDTYNKATTNSITISCSGSKIEGATDDLVLVVDGSSYTLVYVDSTRGWKTINSSGGGGGGGLSWQTITTNTTAESQNGYLINASSGNITVTLPSSPSEGDVVAVCDAYNKADTNTLTVARNGSNIEGITDDLTLDVNGAGFTLVYADATRGWEIVNSIRDAGYYYLFEQATPATVWNVNHNMGHRYVNVQISDSDNMVKQPTSIEFIDNNNLIITFDSVESGHASISIGGITSSPSVGGLVWQTISTSTTALSLNGYLINASSGNVTVTLPLSPSEGDIVGVCDSYNKATTNTITISRNGSNIEGLGEDLILNIDGAGFTLVYTDSTRGWELVGSIGGTFGINIVEDVTPQLGSNLDINEKGIEYDFSSLAVNHTYSGDVITATAGENVSVGDVCYFKSDSKFWKMNAGAEATTKGMCVIATSSISVDTNGIFLTKGLLRNDTWSWTIASELFISITSGVLTSTKPNVVGNIVRIIGYATHSNYIWFDPDKTYLEIS